MSGTRRDEDRDAHGLTAELGGRSGCGRGAILALLVASVAFGGLAAYFQFFRWADHLLYDWQFNLRGRLAPEDVVIVAIDEHSLADLGPWPWPRSVHARLVDRLTELRVRAVALDLPFSEPQRGDSRADEELAAALRRNGRVVLPVGIEGSRGGAELNEKPPIPSLAGAAADVGYPGVEFHRDGAARSLFLGVGPRAPKWRHLAVALHDVAYGAEPGSMSRKLQSSGNASDPGLWVGERRMLIPFPRPPGYFPTYSYVDVLNGVVPDEELRERVVLVGPTVTGPSDAIPTPIWGSDSPMAGIEILANLVDGLARGAMLAPLEARARALATVIVSVLALLGACALPAGRLWARIGLSIAIVVVSGELLLWIAGLWWPSVAGIVAVSLGQLASSRVRLVGFPRPFAEARQPTRQESHFVSDALIRTDLAGSIQYLNRRGRALLGLDHDAELVHRLPALLELASSKPGASMSALFDRCVKTRNPVALDHEPCTVAGRPQPFFVSGIIAPLVEASGRVTGLVTLLGEQSGRPAGVPLRSRPVFSDSITGLPNRRALTHRLRRVSPDHLHDGAVAAAVLIAIDDLVAVMHELGAAATDEALGEIGQRFSKLADTHVFVARRGFDQLALIVGRSADGEDGVDALVQQAIKLVARPIRVANGEARLSARAGVALVPAHARAAEDLIRKAEWALCFAKPGARNRVITWSERLVRELGEQIELEEELRGAVERSELELYYQPQLRLSDGEIVGFEGLVRWRHPTRGLLGPAAFVGLAEKSALMIEQLTLWTLRKGMRQALIWNEGRAKAIRLAINLSPRLLGESGWLTRLREELEETGLNPRLLDLEVTDKGVLQDLGASVETLRELRGLGVQLSLDDFGTGYSSMAILKQLPVDRLKLDRSIVGDLEKEGEGLSTVAALISMAHALGIGVVAKAVETETQLALLRANRCDEIQGYYVSAPASAEQVETMLRNRARAAAGART